MLGDIFGLLEEALLKEIVFLLRVTHLILVCRFFVVKLILCKVTNTWAEVSLPGSRLQAKDCNSSCLMGNIVLFFGGY